MASLYHGTPFHKAIKDGDLGYIKASLSLKQSKSIPDLLHVAAMYGQVEIARLLITRYNYRVDRSYRAYQTPLHMACRNGHFSMIRMLTIEYQAKLTPRDEITLLQEADRCGQTDTISNYCLVKKVERKTILHHICRQGHAELVEILLTQYRLEAELLSTDNDGNIPLHHAALIGNENVLELLIMKYNVDPSSKGAKGRTILHLACLQGHTKLVETLLTQYSLKADIVCKDDDGNTPLHLAALKGNETIIKSLISKYKCPVLQKNYSGQTSLHMACIHGDAKLIDTLLMQCDPDMLLLLLSTCDDNENTPLHYAAFKGNENVLKLLITKYNVNPSSKGAKGRTILHLACRHGYAKLVETLLTQYSLRADIVCRDDDGNIPLHLAALKGNETIAMFLITEYKCPVDFKNYSKQTPLHLACCHGDDKLIKTLLTECASELLSKGDKKRYTPLHYAALNGNKNVVKLLITKYYVWNSNPSSKGADGRTILHLACYQGSVELVEILLTRYSPKTDLHCKDNDGNIPLHLAALGGNENVAKLLVTKYECSLTCENNNNETPLHIACNKGHIGLLMLMVIEFKVDLIHSTLHMAAWQGEIVATKSLIEMLGNTFYSRSSVPSNHECIEETNDRFMARSLSLQSLTNNFSEPICSLFQSTLDDIDIDERVALLCIKYDSKTTSIIRVFVVKCNLKGEFDLYHRVSSVYEGIWYGNTQAIKSAFDTFASSAAVEVLDHRMVLNVACQQGYLEVIKTLSTQYGIDPLSADKNGNTPLHYAAWGGREDVVELLITKYKCQVLVQNCNNQTPLHMACSTGQTNVVGMLALASKHDVTLDIHDKNNDTPLHIAAWYGYTDIVKFLITKFNCDPNCKGLEGRTILHHACLQGHKELVEKIFSSM